MGRFMIFWLYSEKLMWKIYERAKQNTQTKRNQIEKLKLLMYPSMGLYTQFDVI